MRLNASFAADITRAAEILRAGGLVAFPTETVYGLGANALSAEAVEQIFAAKQRPHWDPLIVHIAERAQLQQIAVASSEAERLMDTFWPGPLTLLLPKTSAIPYSVTAGRSLVGVRIPAHPVAQALLREAGVPIAAPSANTFGHTSPTTAEHVLADLDGRIDAVLDGGPTAVGLESTVCETTGAGAIVYRPGGVTVQMLEFVLAQGKITLYHPEPESPPASLPSPGVGIRHYAPRARLQLIEVLQSSASDCLLEPARRALEQGARLGVMLPDDWLTDSRAVLYLWARWSDPATLAQRLFAGLRALDDAGVDLILCPVPTGPGIAEAIRDRLEKAAKQT